VDLYEYQGKQLFARFGIPVSDGLVATTPEEARAAAEQLGDPVMVKAQVLVGGRGKAGGIKYAATPDDAEQHARAILGMDIRGHIVRRLWIERASDIEREYYFSITFDRGAKRPLLMLTTAGGIEIEQVAEETPEKLARLHVDPLTGLLPFHARRLCFAAGIPADEVKQVTAIIDRAYVAFIETDAMLVEINPLIVTPDGIVRALDSKYTVDDNALFRHPDIAEMRDTAAANEQEQLAREKGVNFVKLENAGWDPDGGEPKPAHWFDGARDIGTLANGAGLAMSTIDVVADAGRASGQNAAHLVVRLDGDDLGEPRHERPGQLAGASGEVDHARAGLQPEHLLGPVERLRRVVGPHVVVLGGDPAEAEGQLRHGGPTRRWRASESGTRRPAGSLRARRAPPRGPRGSRSS